MKRGGLLSRGSRLAHGRAMQREGYLRRVGTRMRRRHRERWVFRVLVLQRAGGVCERCEAVDGRKLYAHHLLPRSRGGPDDPDNGAALCRRCHSAVHDHTATDWKDWIR